MENDPAVAFVAKILALFIPVAVAQVIAPQAVIVAAGLAGAIYSLMSWRQSTRIEAAGYVLMWTLCSWLFAFSASAGVAHLFDLPETSGAWLVKLSAAVISGVGHRWPRVFDWAAGLLRTALEARFSK